MSERVRGQGQEPRVHGPRRYLLPVDALLVLMGELEQVFLHARGTTLPGQARGNYQIQLTLRHGTVAACQILSRDGTVVLAGAPALQALRTLGDLAWSLSLAAPTASEPAGEPEPEPGSDPSLEAADWSGIIPHRVPAALALHQLPQRVRHVLSLVDGKRNLAQIARLLHLSLPEVFQILRQAREAGWIE